MPLSDDLELGAVLNPFALQMQFKLPTFPPKKKVLVISGPTGVGKSKLAVDLALLIDGEIISADSMQIYRGMDIGTAKIPEKERQGIRHHLIDSKDLDEDSNVVDYCQEAKQAIKEVFSRDRIPIVVGGTGFYLHALIYGPPGGPAKDSALRQSLHAELEALGSPALYARLEQLDPEYAAKITARDRHKIIRALEIIHLTHQKVSYFSPAVPDKESYDFHAWFLYKPKETLYPLLEKRCEQMLEEGFVQEVEKLQSAGLENNSSARQAIGYRQALEYLKSDRSESSYEKFKMLFKQATRRYAKRQMTWFRKEPLFRWVDIEKAGERNLIEWILQDFEKGLMGS